MNPAPPSLNVAPQNGQNSGGDDHPLQIYWRITSNSYADFRCKRDMAFRILGSIELPMNYEYMVRVELFEFGNANGGK